MEHPPVLAVDELDLDLDIELDVDFVVPEMHGLAVQSSRDRGPVIPNDML